MNCTLCRSLTVMALTVAFPVWAARDLQSLGSGQLLVDPGATTAVYSQTTNALVLSGAYSLGDTLGGTFDGPPQDWTGFTGFGLLMGVTGTNPFLPFTVEFYDTALKVINSYQGTTFGLTDTPSLAMLDLWRVGTGDFSSVVGMQFSWDSGGTIDASISKVVGIEPTSGFFVARAPGGVRFLTSTNQTAGVQLAPSGSSWGSLSDSNAKTDVTTIDHRVTLKKLGELAVTSWSYKHDVSRGYIGPMAQDFHATFRLGSDDKHLTTLDFDGVALSALKGLIAELQERKERSAAQARRLAELEAELQTLREEVRGNLPPAE
jgi:hypothetical protein